jgi:hypothetical protein
MLTVKQVQLGETPLRWVHNVATRWQSDFDMAERALEKRTALTRLYSLVKERWEKNGGKAADRPVILDEELTPAEWDAVTAFQHLLKPFKIATLQLQGDGLQPRSRSTTGGLDEYFEVIEYLLDHLEEALQGRLHVEEGGFTTKNFFEGLDPATQETLKIYIKLGWKKLDSYYRRLTSPAYAAAVIFNPCKKWQALEEQWDFLPDGIGLEYKAKYKQQIEGIWQEKYRNREVDQLHSTAEPPRSSLIERRLSFRQVREGRISRRSRNQNTKTLLQPATDELQKYLESQPIEGYQDPIMWWRDVGRYRYPRLAYMATDYLTIPSSAAATERTFSSSTLMTSQSRNRLQRATIAKAQCLRSWAAAGIYTPAIALELLNDGEMGLETSL